LTRKENKTEYKLQSLPHGVFDKLTRLTYLDLESNKLQSIPSGVFDKLTQLTKLELDHNQIKFLPMGIFDKLTKLTELQLYSNQLKLFLIPCYRLRVNFQKKLRWWVSFNTHDTNGLSLQSTWGMFLEHSQPWCTI